MKQTKMKYKNNGAILVHPTKVEHMKNLGYKVVTEKEPAAKQPAETETNK